MHSLLQRQQQMLVAALQQGTIQAAPSNIHAAHAGEHGVSNTAVSAHPAALTQQADAQVNSQPMQLHAAAANGTAALPAAGLSAASSAPLRRTKGALKAAAAAAAAATLTAGAQPAPPAVPQPNALPVFNRSPAAAPGAASSQDVRLAALPRSSNTRQGRAPAVASAAAPSHAGTTPGVAARTRLLELTDLDRQPQEAQLSSMLRHVAQHTPAAVTAAVPANQLPAAPTAAAAAGGVTPAPCGLAAAAAAAAAAPAGATRATRRGKQQQQRTEDQELPAPPAKRPRRAAAAAAVQKLHSLQGGGSGRASQLEQAAAAATPKCSSATATGASGDRNSAPPAAAGSVPPCTNKAAAAAAHVPPQAPSANAAAGNQQALGVLGPDGPLHAWPSDTTITAAAALQVSSPQGKARQCSSTLVTSAGPSPTSGPQQVRPDAAAAPPASADAVASTVAAPRLVSAAAAAVAPPDAGKSQGPVPAAGAAATQEGDGDVTMAAADAGVTCTQATHQLLPGLQPAVDSTQQQLMGGTPAAVTAAAPPLQDEVKQQLLPCAHQQQQEPGQLELPQQQPQGEQLEQQQQQEEKEQQQQEQQQQQQQQQQHGEQHQEQQHQQQPQEEVQAACTEQQHASHPVDLQQGAEPKQQQEAVNELEDHRHMQQQQQQRQQQDVMQSAKEMEPPRQPQLPPLPPTAATSTAAAAGYQGCKPPPMLVPSSGLLLPGLEALPLSRSPSPRVHTWPAAAAPSSAMAAGQQQPGGSRNVDSSGVPRSRLPSLQSAAGMRPAAPAGRAGTGAAAGSSSSMPPRQPAPLGPVAEAGPCEACGSKRVGDWLDNLPAAKRAHRFPGLNSSSIGQRGSIQQQPKQPWAGAADGGTATDSARRPLALPRLGRLSGPGTPAVPAPAASQSQPRPAPAAAPATAAPAPSPAAAAGPRASPALGGGPGSTSPSPAPQAKVAPSAVKGGRVTGSSHPGSFQSGHSIVRKRVCFNEIVTVVMWHEEAREASPEVPAGIAAGEPQGGAAIAAAAQPTAAWAVPSAAAAAVDEEPDECAEQDGSPEIPSSPQSPAAGEAPVGDVIMSPAQDASDVPDSQQATPQGGPDPGADAAPATAAGGASLARLPRAGLANKGGSTTASSTANRSGTGTNSSTSSRVGFSRLFSARIEAPSALHAPAAIRQLLQQWREADATRNRSKKARYAAIAGLTPALDPQPAAASLGIDDGDAAAAADSGTLPKSDARAPTDARSPLTPGASSFLLPPGNPLNQMAAVTSGVLAVATAAATVAAANKTATVTTQLLTSEVGCFPTMTRRRRRQLLRLVKEARAPPAQARLTTEYRDVLVEVERQRTMDRINCSKWKARKLAREQAAAAAQQQDAEEEEEEQQEQEEGKEGDEEQEQGCGQQQDGQAVSAAEPAGAKAGSTEQQQPAPAEAAPAAAAEAAAAAVDVPPGLSTSMGTVEELTEIALKFGVSRKLAENLAAFHLRQQQAPASNPSRSKATWCNSSLATPAGLYAGLQRFEDALSPFKQLCPQYLDWLRNPRMLLYTMGYLQAQMTALLRLMVPRYVTALQLGALCASAPTLPGHSAHAIEVKLRFLGNLLQIPDLEVGQLILKLPTVLTLSIDRLGKSFDLFRDVLSAGDWYGTTCRTLFLAEEAAAAGKAGPAAAAAGRAASAVPGTSAAPAAGSPGVAAQAAGVPASPAAAQLVSSAACEPAAPAAAMPAGHPASPADAGTAAANAAASAANAAPSAANTATSAANAAASAGNTAASAAAAAAEDAGVLAQRMAVQMAQLAPAVFIPNPVELRELMQMVRCLLDKYPRWRALHEQLTYSQLTAWLRLQRQQQQQVRARLLGLLEEGADTLGSSPSHHMNVLAKMAPKAPKAKRSRKRPAAASSSQGQQPRGTKRRAGQQQAADQQQQQEEQQEEQQQEGQQEQQQSQEKERQQVQVQQSKPPSPTSPAATATTVQQPAAGSSGANGAVSLQLGPRATAAAAGSGPAAGVGVQQSAAAASAGVAAGSSLRLGGLRRPVPASTPGFPVQRLLLPPSLGPSDRGPPAAASAGLQLGAPAAFRVVGAPGLGQLLQLRPFLGGLTLAGSQQPLPGGVTLGSSQQLCPGQLLGSSQERLLVPTPATASVGVPGVAAATTASLSAGAAVPAGAPPRVPAQQSLHS